MKFVPLKQLTYCLLLLVSNAFAQSDSTSVHHSKKNKSSGTDDEGKDITDIVKVKVKQIGDIEPVEKSGKSHITILPVAGYTLQTRWAAILAGNIAFYLSDKDDETNQSAISMSVSYSQNRQVVLPIISNIWTKNNKYNFLGNWRYYKYPEQTFGLGGHTSLQDLDKLDYSYIVLREAILKHFSNSDFYAGMGYNLSYHTNIHEGGYANGDSTDFEKYGKTANSTSSGISVHGLYDNRGNTINPPKGGYANVTYCPYLKVLGSNNNWQSLIIDLRKYFKGRHSKNVFAIWSYSWFTYKGKAPYLDLPSTGWDTYSNIGRGYIQSRLRGKNLLYLEAEYRFGITPNGLIGGVLFGNAQSVSDWPSNKFNTIYPAGGTGVRIKLNKHSGTNLSIDYGVGIKGSKGLFINLGEVF